MSFNIVELAASIDEDDCAADQRCIFGNRVAGHAVYCHNDNWEDSPRKCRRSWYTNGETKDEDCPGYKPNPEFKGTLAPTAVVGPPCRQCVGNKTITTDRGKIETCPLCMGSGSQPEPLSLSVYEQNTLELGSAHSGCRDTAGHPFVRIARNDEEKTSIDKIHLLNLIVVRSVNFAGHLSVYLLENTMKGEAVMHLNWNAARK